MRFILALCIVLFGVPALACDTNCGALDDGTASNVPPPQSKNCDAKDCDSEPVILFGRVLDVTEDVNDPNQKVLTIGPPDAPMVLKGLHR